MPKQDSKKIEMKAAAGPGSKISKEVYATVFSFLKGEDLQDTSKKFLKEAGMKASELEGATGKSDLILLWEARKGQKESRSSSSSSSDDSSSSSSAESESEEEEEEEEEEKKPKKATLNTAPAPAVTFKGASTKTANSGSSSDSSESDAKPAAVAKKVFAKTPIPVMKPDSSEDSSSDSGSDSDAKPKSVLPVKRKLVDSSDEESGSGSGSGSDSDSENEKQPATKKRKASVASSSSSSSSSSSDSDSDRDSEDSEAERVATQARVKARQLELKKKSEESALAAAAWMAKANEAPIVKKAKAATRSPAEAFKRVDAEIWNKEILAGLADNSYAKAFGENGFGAKASEKLLTVQGKKFQHEKTKKKRGSYRGGVIFNEERSNAFFKYDSDFGNE